MPKSAPLKHQVRIIAGAYRRRLLPVVDAPESIGLRPTPDRVRQTLFNWLEHFLPDWGTLHVLDCFAGTGALGLEAASRGAASVRLCEQFVPAARQLQATVDLLQAAQCTVRGGDALAALASTPPASIGLIFLDPPFNSGWLPKLHAPVARALATNGLVYAESETTIEWQGFEVLRQMKAGAVQATLLRKLV
jgi:16S rRNA (guanine966-N2)-methyltransferase